MRELSVYARWGVGVLELRVRGELFTVRAANAELFFEPRSVVVEARYAGRRSVSDDRRLRVYIDLADEIKPLEPRRVDLIGSRALGLFEVRVTDVEFRRYLTVITPAGFLYDFFIVSDDTIMLEASAKRRVFFEEEPFDKIIVYLA
jgi:hypothetical protein